MKNFKKKLRKKSTKKHNNKNPNLKKKYIFKKKCNIFIKYVYFFKDAIQLEVISRPVSESRRGTLSVTHGGAQAGWKILFLL